MPFIHLSLTDTLKDTQKEYLATQIGKIIENYLGKKFEKTMIRIDDHCAIYRGGVPANCAFMETRLKAPNTLSDQKCYIDALYILFNEYLGLHQAQCYFNILELPTWGSQGCLH